MNHCWEKCLILFKTATLNFLPDLNRSFFQGIHYDNDHHDTLWVLFIDNIVETSLFLMIKSFRLMKEAASANCNALQSK